MNGINKAASNALKLFVDFNKNGVRYCHWKSNEHLLSGLQGFTDMDILIDPADAAIAYQLMARNNYKQVISHPWKRYSAVDDWIGLDEEKMLQTHLHIHYRLLTGLKNVKEQYFSLNEVVLNNTYFDDEYHIRICNPNIEIILLFVRAALKKSGFIRTRSVLNNDAQREYEYLKEKTTKEQLTLFIHQMFSDALAEDFITMYDNPEDKRTFLRFKREVIHSQNFLQRISRGKAEIIYLWRMAIYKTRKMIKKPIKLKKKSVTGGKLISFIGMDGAGKTTLATFFVKWLSWKIDCRYVYLGTGDGKSSYLNRIKKRMIGSKTIKNVEDPKQYLQNKSGKKSLTKQVKKTAANLVYYSNARYKYKTIKKMFAAINDGTIVVTDRYPQMDFFGIYDGMTIQKEECSGVLGIVNRYLAKKEYKLYSEMCQFNPDIIVKLDISLEESCRRKPCSGKELEILKKKEEITKRLHYKGSKELIVDSSGDLEETKNEILSLLWRYL